LIFLIFIIEILSHTSRGMFIIPPDSYRDGAGFTINMNDQLGVDKKHNRIVGV